jgi:hypothetical protein
VAQTGLLVSLDMMASFRFYAHSRLTNEQEVNPTLGDETEVEQTVAIGRSLVRSALGKSLLGSIVRNSRKQARRCCDEVQSCNSTYPA